MRYWYLSVEVLWGQNCALQHLQYDFSISLFLSHFMSPLCTLKLTFCDTLSCDSNPAWNGLLRRAGWFGSALIQHSKNISLAQEYISVSWPLRHVGSTPRAIYEEISSCLSWHGQGGWFVMGNFAKRKHFTTCLDHISSITGVRYQKDFTDCDMQFKKLSLPFFF